MTTEQIFTAVMTYLEKTTDENRDFCLKAFERGEHLPKETIEVCPLFAISNLALDLKEQLAVEAAKSAGKAKPRSAALRLIKSSVKSTANASVHGAWLGKDGRQYMTNGAYIVALNTPLDLPTAEGAPNLERVLTDPRREDLTEIPLPTVAELKAFIKTEKALGRKERKGEFYYDFGKNLPRVNSEFLLTILEILPNAKAVYCPAMETRSTLTFTSPDGEALLMPCYKPHP